MQEKLESVAAESFAARPRGSRSKRTLRLAAGFALVATPLLGAGSACLDRPIGAPPPVTTNIFVDRITQTAIDKIDLLFMIDNSISMSDKQAILRLAVPDLVNRLVNPICVDVNGNQFDPPPAGSDRCPDGPQGQATSREFNPINDINIAIVSSSLGDAGANEACSAGSNPDSVDGAHLMGSNVPGTTVNRGRVPLSQPEGYLQWRPGVDVNNLIQNFQNQVTAVGQVGCGWEASLESWFRFLIDPFPYAELQRVTCNPGDTRTDCVRPRVDAEGRIVTDANILAQRSAFLRPDSLVSIIMLTDENDCSIEPLPQNWVVAAIGSQTSMFRGSSACDTNPNDPCCHPCVLNPPAGCPAEANCSAAPGDEALKRLPDAADGRNLRCFDQKRRFGYDFLYPTERYVNALRGRNGFCWSDRALTTNEEECVDGRGQRVGLTANPLYEGGRDESSVFLAGIVGVPWQAISTNVDGNGRPLAANQLRFKPAPEFTEADWNAIAGNPGTADGVAPSPPTNAYMVETPVERTNVPAGNEFNGRDYNTAQGQNAGVRDDLQYACIFPLPPGEERNCANSQQGANDCDCSPDENDKPLCQQEPGVSANTTTQYYAKAYPGLRELQVLRDYGDNSIIASICAKNVDNQASPDFGYRPAIAAIVDRLKEKLGDRCLPRRLQPGDDDTIPCSLVEVQLGVTSCSCDNSIARFTPSAETTAAVRSRLLADDQQPCGSDTTCQNVCLCEVQQVTDPAELNACQQDVDATGIEGWCYIADTEDQEIGNPALVANCPATERRLLRFVGAGLRPNTVTYVSCQGSSFDPGVSEL
jgi:hypothetical protein